jgi:hypothetical protein
MGWSLTARQQQDLVDGLMGKAESVATFDKARPTVLEPDLVPGDAFGPVRAVSAAPSTDVDGRGLRPADTVGMQTIVGDVDTAAQNARGRGETTDGGP